METKNNKGLIILILVLVLLVIGFGGYFVYDQFIADNSTKKINNNNNDNNNSNSITDTDSNTDKDNNNNNSTNKDITNNTQIDYTGTYLSVDGDPNDAYIELYSNNTYKRNNNNCSEITIWEGTYLVNIENGITTIKFTSGTSEYGVPADRLDAFVYEDGKLSIIDNTNTYAYYDCTNSRTFQKK